MQTVHMNSPAPMQMPFPFPPRSKVQVDIQEVLEVLRKEGASSEMILAVKELTIPC